MPVSTPSGDLFPIRTVCSLTGVNPITLRAWERRYGLVRPVRTIGGHRVYSRGDIDTVNRILALARSGVAIGRMREALAGDAPPADAADPGPWAGYRQRMSAAIACFDERQLDAVYDEMLSLHGIDRVTREALMPLFAALGERWQQAEGGIAEEHFFAVFLRNKLGARFHHRSLDAEGPRLLLACLPGEHHEVGLLLFALAAHDEGFRLVLLGADMPLAELPPALQRSQADAVVLSGSVAPAAALLQADLPAFVAGAARPVFVGGPASILARDAIVTAGAQPLGADIGAGLAQIGLALGHRLRRAPGRA